MNSSNIADNRTQPYHDNEVKIPVVAEVVGASKTDERIPNQLTGPPVEVFTTTVSNVSEWSVEETLTEASTLSSVGVEKRSSRFGGDRPPVAVINS